ncbi:hypothetical protein HD554DRAFT_2135073 [Boletus coccyginus]|nr:hypothetical protein HD554DRAFT_2135073 [Boletus coccyginus]
MPSLVTRGGAVPFEVAKRLCATKPSSLVPLTFLFLFTSPTAAYARDRRCRRLPTGMIEATHVQGTTQHRLGLSPPERLLELQFTPERLDHWVDIARSSARSGGASRSMVPILFSCPQTRILECIHCT